MSKAVEKKEEGLKLLKASITNFKNIDYREVDLGGRSMILAGPNRIGKSSLLQALTSPINSKFMPIEPIKKGEEKGSIELTIGGKLHDEEVLYTIGCYFSQEHQRGRIVLQDSEGHRISSSNKVFIDILGDISFDIFGFVRMARTDQGKHSDAGVKKQIELLKSLMPREILIQLHKLDTEYSKVFAERTEINSEVKYLDAQIKNNAFTIEEIEKYNEPLKAEDVSAKIEEARKKNEMFGKAKSYVTEKDAIKLSVQDDLIALLESASIKDTELEIQNKLFDLVENKAFACKNYMDKNPLIDLEVLNTEMNNISTHNLNVEKIKNLQAEELKLKGKQTDSETKTKRLEQIQAKKKTIFASSPLPVKGLEFNEEAVLYDGLPLNEDQHPTSVLIGVGLRIGMALNPNLRLLIIREGSLLDKKSMDFILKTCEKNNYQVLIEVVKPEGDSLEIEFIEKKD